jgi:beta-galactosidase beta subunit
MDFGFQLGGSTPIVNAYGSFFDLTTQIATPNTPTPMLCNTIDFVNNINYNITTGEIEVLVDGIYNLQFSAQTARSTGTSAQEIDIWFVFNGTAIPNSATKIDFQGNNRYIVASWNYFLSMNAGDRVQIFYRVTNTQIVLQYEPENLIVPFPAIPSVIKTINKIADL